MIMTMAIIEGKLYGWYKKADVKIDENMIPLTTDLRAPDTIVRHKRHIACILSCLPEDHATRLQQGNTVHVKLTRSSFLNILTQAQIA